MRRVLHLIPDLGLGGAQRALCYLAGAMDRERYRLEVAHWGEAADLRKDLEEVGVGVTRLEVKAGSLPSLALAVGRHLRRARPDLLHTHLFDADLVGTLAGRALGLRGCCSTIHSFSFFFTRAHRWRYRCLAPLVGRFFPVSHALGALLTERCGIPPARVQVIPNGIDAALFAPPAAGEARPSVGPTIGALARLDPRKGLPFLLQALARLLPDLPEATLLIGGDGEDRAALERQAHELNLAGQVVFAGPVHDPPAFYRCCDLFVLPSLDEGFGLVVLEAMASGLPVIGTRVGGVPELIEHGRNGLLVEPGDASAIAAALRTLWADPALRGRLAEAGRSTAARFSSARAAAQTQAVYEVLA